MENKTTEGCIGAEIIQGIIHTVVHKLFDMAIIATVKKLYKDPEMLPRPFIVMNALNGRSWTEFSHRPMQVPEGLHGSIYRYVTIMGDIGIPLLIELMNLIKYLLDILTIANNNKLMDMEKLDVLYAKFIAKRDFFYTEYKHVVNDNGLSHQPIYMVIHSVPELEKWYTITTSIKYGFSKEDLLRWEKLLELTAVALTTYTESDAGKANPQTKRIVDICQEVGGSLALVSIVTLGLQQNYTSARLLAESILTK